MSVPAGGNEHPPGLPRASTACPAGGTGLHPGKENGMTEVVHLRDGDAVTLRPCPRWCTVSRHFPDGIPVDADDGYHHDGPEDQVPTSYPFGGLTDGPPTVVRVQVRSWTHPLGARPGSAFIDLNLGTAERGTDACAELTPAEARSVARALLDLAAVAEQDGQASAGGEA